MKSFSFSNFLAIGLQSFLDHPICAIDASPPAQAELRPTAAGSPFFSFPNRPRPRVPSSPDVLQ
jgi:hypothetical protein